MFGETQKSMAIRKIIHVPDVKLRQKANKIKIFTPDLKRLVADMFETMRGCQGVGLAGPQIGVMQRILVAEIGPPEDENVEPHPQSGIPYVLINPYIVKTAGNLVEGQEGCLSMPGWAGLVDRPEWVELQAQNIVGDPIKIKAVGLLGRIFLHEIDHLNGILYTDHITHPDKLWQIEPEDVTESPEKAEIV